MKRKTTSIKYLFFSFLIICSFKRFDEGNFESNYWNVIETRTFKKASPINCYFFDKDNELKYFYYKKDDKGHNIERINVDIFTKGEVRYPNTWRLLSDSIIEIMGFKYTYHFISRNKVLLRNINDKSDYEILQKVNN